MLATVVAVALSSCSKIDDNEIINNKQYSITATIPGDLTRTSYTDMTAEDGKGLKVQWEENESISVVEVKTISTRLFIPSQPRTQLEPQPPLWHQMNLAPKKDTNM